MLQLLQADTVCRCWAAPKGPAADIVKAPDSDCNMVCFSPKAYRWFSDHLSHSSALEIERHIAALAIGIAFPVLLHIKS